jgi:hypothetical protein
LALARQQTRRLTNETWATAFCRSRRYLSTMYKQGQRMLTALAALFVGKPFPVVWGI